MSSTLLELGLTNAVLALLMSLVTLLIIRWKKHAQLASLLWLVVLIKFVTPPLLPYSIQIESPLPAVDVVVQDEPTPESETIPEFELPPDFETVVDFEDSEWTIDDPPEKVLAFEEPSEQTEIPFEIIDIATPATTPPWYDGMADRCLSLLTVRNIFWLWVTGTLCSLSIWLIYGFRFNRLIKSGGLTEPAEELESALQQLCVQMKLKRIPELRVVHAQISPLIWTWGFKTTVLLPRELIRELSLEQQSMVLAHELAHIKRLDHQFRWLEMLVQSLYWWFPPVRWIRRQLHTAQEECCDAWVDRLFPEHRVEYGETLLTTAVWLNDSPRAPIWASEFGSNPGLKKRIEVMLEQGFANPLSKPVLFSCLLIGLAISVCSIRWVTAEELVEEASEVDVVAEETSDQQSNVETILSTETNTNTPPSHTTIHITGPKGNPVPAGTLTLRGFWKDGTRISQPNMNFEQGKALLNWAGKSIETMVLSIEAPGYLTCQRKFFNQPGASEVQLNDQYTIKLKPGIEIGGTVQTKQRSPLAGVTVQAKLKLENQSDSEVHLLEKSVLTNENGNWIINGVPENLDNLQLEFKRPGYVPFKSTNEVLLAQHGSLKAKTDLRHMQRTPNLTGTIIDEAGRAVKGAHVVFYNRDRFYRDPNTAKPPLSDQSGQFSLNNLLPGAYELVVYSLESGYRKLSVRIPDTKHLELRLKSLNRVEFNVIDLQGKPVPNVSINPYISLFDFGESLTEGNQRALRNAIPRPIFKTNSYGKVIWKQAPDHNVHFNIRADGFYSQQHIGFDPQETPYTRVLKRIIKITGKVLDAKTGKPIPKFNVLRLTPKNDIWQEIEKDTYGRKHESIFENGDFSIPVPERTTEFRCRFSADGYLPVSSEVFTFQKNQETIEPITVKMKSDAGFQNVVLKPDGSPAAGAKVIPGIAGQSEDYRPIHFSEGNIFLVPRRLNSEEHQYPVEITTDQSGTFVISSGLHHSTLNYFIVHQSGYALLVEDELIQNPEIKLTPWSTVEGQLLIEGKPAVGYSVRVGRNSRIRSFTSLAATDENGKFKLENCISDNCEIEFRNKNKDGVYSLHTSPFSIPKAKTIQFVLGDEEVDVIGKLVDSENKPLDLRASSLIHVYQLKINETKQPQFMNREWLRLKADGSFRIHNLKPVDSIIRFSTSGSRSELKSLEISFTAEMWQNRKAGEPVNIGEVTMYSARGRRTRTSAEKTKKEQAHQNKPQTLFKIIDQEGKPISGGQLTASGYLTDGARFHQKQREIKNGQVTVNWESDPIDSMLVDIEVPGYLRFQKKFFKEKSNQSIKIQPQYTLQLKKGIEIGGKVVDENNQPLEGVKVRVTVPVDIPNQSETHSTRTTVFTDEAGNWRATGVPANLDHLGLGFSRAGYVTPKSTKTILKVQSEGLRNKTDVRKLSKVVTLTGQVANASGEPVPRAAIHLKRNEDRTKEELFNRFPMTDKNGRFELTHLPKGEYTLSVYSPEHGFKHQTVKITKSTEVSVTLKSLSTIKFRILDQTGNPMYGIRVHPHLVLDELHRYEGEDFIFPKYETEELELINQLSVFNRLIQGGTGENGIVEIKNVPSAPILYSFHSYANWRDFPRDRVEYFHGLYKPGNSIHPVNMRFLPRLTGQVIDAETEEPITYYSLMKSINELYRNGDWRYLEGGKPYSRVHKQGLFHHSLDKADQGCKFRVNAKGYLPLASKPITFDGTQKELPSIQFKLIKAVEFQGTIVQPDGQPANEAQIYVLTNSDFRTKSEVILQEGKLLDPRLRTELKPDLVSDSSGNYKLSPPRNYFACFISHPSGYVHLIDGELFAQPKLKLTPWVSIKGKRFSKQQTTLTLNHESTFIDFKTDVPVNEQGEYHIEKWLAGKNRLRAYRLRSRNQNFENWFSAQILFKSSADAPTLLNVGENQVDLIGKVSLPEAYQFNPEKKYNIMVSHDLSTNERNHIQRFVENVALQSDGSFHLFSLLPVPSNLHLRIDSNFEHALISETIKLTPEMWKDRVEGAPINLGTVKLKVDPHF